MQVVALLERELGREVHKELLPMQPGDVPATYADIEDLTRDIDFRPATSIEDGVHKFVACIATSTTRNRLFTPPARALPPPPPVK